MDAVLQHRFVEVEEQAKLAACQPQVAQGLCKVDIMDILNRFDLNDDALINPQIKSKAQVQLLAFVTDRDRVLLKER